MTTGEWILAAIGALGGGGGIAAVGALWRRARGEAAKADGSAKGTEPIRPEFDALERRVTAVERRQDRQDERIDGIDRDALIRQGQTNERLAALVVEVREARRSRR